MGRHAVEVTGTGGIVHLPDREHLFTAARSGILLVCALVDIAHGLR